MKVREVARKLLGRAVRVRVVSQRISGCNPGLERSPSIRMFRPLAVDEPVHLGNAVLAQRRQDLAMDPESRHAGDVGSSRGQIVEGDGHLDRRRYRRDGGAAAGKEQHGERGDPHGRMMPHRLPDARSGKGIRSAEARGNRAGADQPPWTAASLMRTIASMSLRLAGSRSMNSMAMPQGFPGAPGSSTRTTRARPSTMRRFPASNRSSRV